MRPQKDRIVAFNPHVSYFKPRGIPMVDLEEVRLTVDECEALRLSDLIDLSHEDGGRQMGVSRATFGRILQNAHRTVADALINGRAINIEGGNYKMTTHERIFECDGCAKRWSERQGTGRPRKCPTCGSKKLFRISSRRGSPPG
ncbi:MAG: DUF134 domain-containing protein [Desulfosarcina sp.]|nr:DUF134 domain-containing protein [Desulfobacterales bacterium]